MFLVCHVILQNCVTKSYTVVTLWEELLNVSQHSVMFGGHRHCGSREVIVLVCHMILEWWRHQHLLGKLTWMNFLRCTCLPNSVVIGLMEMEIFFPISVLAWISWKKLHSTPWSDILRDSQNQEYRFVISKSWTWLVEKPEKEGEEEYRQL